MFRGFALGLAITATATMTTLWLWNQHIVEGNEEEETQKIQEGRLQQKLETSWHAFPAEEEEVCDV